MKYQENVSCVSIEMPSTDVTSVDQFLTRHETDFQETTRHETTTRHDFLKTTRHETDFQERKNGANRGQTVLFTSWLEILIPTHDIR